MKNLIPLYILAFLFVACDPPIAVYQGDFTFPVKVVNPRDTINLGDSVCFIFEIPDTINVSGRKIRPYYGSKDGASFPISNDEIDTLSGGGFRPFSINLKEYATPGTTQGGVILAPVSNYKCYTKYYLIPQKKGVYFLDLPQGGYFSSNDQSFKARALYTLDVPDKHHNLLISSTRPQDGMAGFLQGRASLGLEVYAFAVK